MFAYQLDTCRFPAFKVFTNAIWFTEISNPTTSWLDDREQNTQTWSFWSTMAWPNPTVIQRQKNIFLTGNAGACQELQDTWVSILIWEEVCILIQHLFLSNSPFIEAEKTPFNRAIKTWWFRSFGSCLYVLFERLLTMAGIESSNQQAKVWKDWRKEANDSSKRSLWRFSRYISNQNNDDLSFFLTAFFFTYFCRGIRYLSSIRQKIRVWRNSRLWLFERAFRQGIGTSKRTRWWCIWLDVAERRKRMGGNLQHQQWNLKGDY